MGKYKAANNLEMIDDEEIEEPGGQPFIFSDSKLVIMKIPKNAILEGNMYKLSSKDALEIIANLAVQVALDA